MEKFGNLGPNWTRTNMAVRGSLVMARLGLVGVDEVKKVRITKRIGTGRM